jgi:hypothetical protein
METGQRCEREANVWRLVRARGTNVEWLLCRSVHAYGPITVRGQHFDDADLTPAVDLGTARPATRLMPAM